jgi:hypothetical protein
MVHVDQGQVTDAAAGQGLDRPGAHPADPDHAQPGRSQPRQGRGAEQAGDAAEAAR